MTLMFPDFILTFLNNFSRKIAKPKDSSYTEVVDIVSVETPVQEKDVDVRKPESTDDRKVVCCKFFKFF